MLTREWVKTQFQNFLAYIIGMLFGYVTPQMFGAKGDGVTDDTEAIQSAFNHGGTIFFPEGTYIVSKAHATGQTVIIIGKQNTRVMGCGEKSIIKPADDINKNMTLFAFGTPNQVHQNISFENITIRGIEYFGNSSSGMSMIDFTNCKNVRVTKCTFQNNQYANIRLLNGGNYFTFENCRFEASDCGIIAMGNYPVSDIIIRDCVFTGMSSYNSYCNYSSEPISIFQIPPRNSEDYVSYRWYIDGCRFEHKHTNAICIGNNSEKTMEADDTRILYKDITVSNCEFGACTGAVIIRHSENVNINNIHILDTEPNWKHVLDWSQNDSFTLNRIITFTEYCLNCTVRNVVSDCKEYVQPIVIGGGTRNQDTNKDCIVDNVILYSPISVDNSFLLFGEHNTLRDIVVKPIGNPTYDNNIYVAIKNAHNCYVDVRGDELGGTHIVYRNMGTNDSVYNNVFVVDNNSESFFSESFRLDKKSVVSANKWRTRGELVRSAHVLTDIISNYLDTKKIVDFTSLDNYNTALSTDSWTLMSDGTEVEIIFKNTNVTTGKPFEFANTGNIVSRFGSFTFSNDYNVSCKFKQVGNTWVEISRSLVYADGSVIPVEPKLTSVENDVNTLKQLVLSATDFADLQSRLQS